MIQDIWQPYSYPTLLLYTHHILIILAPSDFYFVSKLEKVNRRQKESNEEFIAATEAYFADLD